MRIRYSTLGKFVRGGGRQTGRRADGQTMWQVQNLTIPLCSPVLAPPNTAHPDAVHPSADSGSW